jgi:hypothetical protein
VKRGGSLARLGHDHVVACHDVGEISLRLHEGAPISTSASIGWSSTSRRFAPRRADCATIRRGYRRHATQYAGAHNDAFLCARRGRRCRQRKPRTPRCDQRAWDDHASSPFRRASTPQAIVTVTGRWRSSNPISASLAVGVGRRDSSAGR